MIEESRLVQALEPFRGYVEACVLYWTHQTDICRELLSGKSLDRIVEERELDPERMEAVRLFLTTAGYLDPHTRQGTAKLQGFHDASGWYEMMIGGYGETFLNIGKGFEKNAPPIPRDGALVGSGSCEISKHDSLPVVKRLIEASGRRYEKLIDVGCGSGIYMTELCRAYPRLRAIGTDPSDGAIEAAREHVAQSDCADRIELTDAPAEDWMRGHPDAYDLGVICFVLHEIHGQSGEAGVDHFLSEFFGNSPNADLIVIDIDLKWHDQAFMHHPLARNYYNQYFLLHPFTEQRLEPASYWDEKFSQHGLTVVNRFSTYPSMDSTGIVVGWHLSKREAA